MAVCFFLVVSVQRDVCVMCLTKAPKKEKCKMQEPEQGKTGKTDSDGLLWHPKRARNDFDFQFDFDLLCFYNG